MSEMNEPAHAEDADPGLFDARYLAFLETITHLRPRLHRYCARMTGSVLDGEDVVQDALFQAFRNLDTFDERRALAPWLFRIAHNRCVDVLRQRAARQSAEAEAALPEAAALAPALDAHGPAITRALEHLVLALPPKERACVLLKDIFDYSLEEVAELVDSTVGGVKAALSRGRSRLAALPRDAAPMRPESTMHRGELLALVREYVDRFNRRDWDGVRDLIASDARVRVADRFIGRLADSPYVSRYQSWTMPWRLAVAEVDQEPAVVVLWRRPDTAGQADAAGETGGTGETGVTDGGWKPRTIVRLRARERRVAYVADYSHCPWVLASVSSLVRPDAA
jgi:RNA polymerase sigma-70 factor (ECF subfamily)